MNLKRSRGLTLLMSCLINLCIGSAYSWSVFAGPLAERLTALGGAAYSASDLGIVFTVYNIPGPFCMTAGGWLNRRIEVRRLIQMGSVLFVAGLLLCSMATTLGGLVVGFGLLVGVGVGTVYGCTVNNSVKLFPDKRGLAGGLTTGVYGLSSVLVPPVANVMIRNWGVSAAFQIIAVCFAVVLLLASAFVEQGPEEAGQMLPGGGRDMSWREMLCQKKFYGMCAMLLCGLMVSVLSLFNAGGRASAGILSDKLGRIGTLSLVFPISVAALCALFFFGQDSMAVFAVSIALVGACFGALMGIFPGFTADEFGQRNNTVNYGILFFGFALSGMLGPQVASWVMSGTGSYRSAFLIAAVVALAGFAFTFLHRRLAARS